MPIHTCCPGCGASYNLHVQLQGHKARCKHCRQYFIISGQVTPDDVPLTLDDGTMDAIIVEDEGIQATPPAAAASAPSPTPEPAAPVPPRKKKLRKPAPGSSLGLRIGIAGGAAVLLTGGVVALVVVLLTRHREPELVGRWKSSVQVREDVDKALQGTNVNPVVGKFLEGIGQKAADELLAITIHFKRSDTPQRGHAFYSGHTSTLGLRGDADGDWEVVRAEGDVLTVRMGTARAPFEARLAFRDRDSFTLTRLDQKDQPPLLFTRVSE
jgi:hypothetical protein